MIVLWLFVSLFVLFPLMVIVALLIDYYFERLHKRPFKIEARELNKLRTTVKFHNVPKEGDHD